MSGTEPNEPIEIKIEVSCTSPTIFKTWKCRCGKRVPLGKKCKCGKQLLLD